MLATLQLSRRSPIETTATDIDQRFSALESQITELKSLILQGASKARAEKEDNSHSSELRTANISDCEVSSSTPEASKLEEKPLLSIPRVVSCAASSCLYACACPGSVAAYHGALSRAPPYFEPLLTALGTYRTLSPFYFDLVSDKTRVRCHTDSGNGQSLDSLQLTFSRDQLINYKKWRIKGLDRKSSNWMNKAAEIVWNCTRGIISKMTMDAVRDVALSKYKCVYSQRKVLNFTKGLCDPKSQTTLLVELAIHQKTNPKEFIGRNG